jgi:lipid-A-disaccharide synthase
MQKQGFEAIMPFAPFNRMGLSEVLSNILFFTRAEKVIIREMSNRRPAVVVLVDYAGFNIRIMKAALRSGIPVVWYIAPKVWAWKKKRAPVIASAASEIACILPFEPAHFQGFSAKPVYVGNPCVEELIRKYGPNLRPFGRTGGKAVNRVALVPGSRPQEIRRILEPMAAAGDMLRKKYGVELKISVYQGLDKSLFQDVLDKYGIEPFSGPLDELLAWADCAMVTSGTATLQTALMEVPHVLVYKTSLFNYVAFKAVVRLKFVGLPNIIAKKEIIKECLQKKADPIPLAAEMSRFIEDPEYYAKTKRELSHLKNELGVLKPSEQVAGIIEGHLGGGK